MVRIGPRVRPRARRRGVGVVVATLLLSCLLMIGIPPIAAAETPPPPAVVLLDQHELVAAWVAARAGDPALQPALTALRQQADRALGRGPFTVTTKTVAPFSGDVHDYVSLSIYWWPDPSSPTGLPFLQRDGVRNPAADDTSQYDANPLNQMGSDVETLALAYFLTGESRYGGYAADLVRTWFLAPETRMNPNFRFAQIIPGRDAIRGIGIIESRRFRRVVDGVALLSGCGCWSANDDQALRAWFAEFETWLRTSPHGQMESKTTNNHAVWYDVQAADFALFAGDTPTATTIVSAAGEARIATHIAADGSMPREIERTRSFHYSNFNLQAFFELAVLGEHIGVDLWHYQAPDSGSSIHSALDFLIPYIRGDAKWPYEQITSDNPFAETAQTLRRAAAVYPDGPYQSILDQLSADQSPLTLLKLRLGYWSD